MTQNKGIFGGHQWDMQVLKDEEGHDYFELKCFYCGEERWG